MGVGKSLKSPSAFPPVLLVFVTRSQDSHSLDYQHSWFISPIQIPSSPTNIKGSKTSDNLNEFVHLSTDELSNQATSNRYRIHTFIKLQLD